MAITFYAPRESKAGVCFDLYTPELLQKHSDFIFVFGDNEKRYGTAGQAIIRNEPNSFGFITKHGPDALLTSYMKGTELDYYHVDKCFTKLRKLLAEGTTIVFPSSGLGTGLARLADTAPELLAFIDATVSELISTNYKLLRFNSRGNSK